MATNNLLNRSREIYEGFDKAIDDHRLAFTYTGTFAGPNASAADVTLTSQILTIAQTYVAAATKVKVTSVKFVSATAGTGASVGQTQYLVSGTGANNYTIVNGDIVLKAGTNWTTAAYTMQVAFNAELT